MEQHPYFNLYLHTTTELESILGEPIASRTTLHEWPLSCVQSLTMSTGKKLIYKSQNGATIEPLFYSQADSSLLPNHQYLGHLNGCETMLFEYIDAPLLNSFDLSEDEAASHARAIIDRISKIAGEPPVYTDIGTHQKWFRFASATIEMLEKLIQSGAFTITERKACTELRRWAESPNLDRIIETTSGLTHGDPNGDNIFVLDSGYRIIDWQRPRCAPRMVDMAALLEGAGYDPCNHVDINVARIFWFLKLNWVVECKTNLFPQGVSYDRYATDFCNRLLGSI